MASIELIKQLRTLTNAGMADCKSALDESQDDLQKAIDIIKVRGQNISDSRSAKVAAEGRVAISHGGDLKVAAMVEINCQTDFVANCEAFVNFAEDVAYTLADSIVIGTSFQATDVEFDRKETISATKENVVVRRWWAEEATNPAVRVFSYLHSNNKIGVLLTMQAPSEAAAESQEFNDLGSDLAMQICAMNPLGVSADRISTEEVERQKAIFETQLREDVKPKPEAMWPKIIEGKFKKYYKDVCLLEQESVLVAKSNVQQVIDNVSAKLGGAITVINFVRAEVGDGIEVNKNNFAEEVAKMVAPEEPGGFIKYGDIIPLNGRGI